MANPQQRLNIKPEVCVKFPFYQVNDCQPEAGSIDLVSGM